MRHCDFCIIPNTLMCKVHHGYPLSTKPRLNFMGKHSSSQSNQISRKKPKLQVQMGKIDKSTTCEVSCCKYELPSGWTVLTVIMQRSLPVENQRPPFHQDWINCGQRCHRRNVLVEEVPDCLKTIVKFWINLLQNSIESLR